MADFYRIFLRITRSTDIDPRILKVRYVLSPLPFTYLTLTCKRPKDASGNDTAYIQQYATSIWYRDQHVTLAGTHIHMGGWRAVGGWASARQGYICQELETIRQLDILLDCEQTGTCSLSISETSHPWTPRLISAMLTGAFSISPSEDLEDCIALCQPQIGPMPPPPNFHLLTSTHQYLRL